MKILDESLVRLKYVPGRGATIVVQWLIEDLETTSIELLDAGLIKNHHFAEHHRVTLLQAHYLADFMRKNQEIP